MPKITLVDINTANVDSAITQAKPNDAKSIDLTPKFQGFPSKSSNIDSFTLKQTAAPLRTSLPKSSNSQELTSTESEPRPEVETSKLQRRERVAGAKFEDVAESLIVDLLRAVSRRKTLSEEVRSLCLAALRTLVVAHPQSIYLRPILEEKRALHHAAAAAAAAAREKLPAKQRNAAPKSAASEKDNTEESRSNVPEKQAKGAPFPKELKYPLPFTVVEYISKVDNFNRQFLCYIDVCYGANMVCKIL